MGKAWVLKEGSAFICELSDILTDGARVLKMEASPWPMSTIRREFMGTFQ